MAIYKSMLRKLRVGLGNAPHGDHENLLAEVRFSNLHAAPSEPRIWPLGLPALGAGPACERWYVEGPVDDIHSGNFHGSNSADWAWVGSEIEIEPREAIVDASCQLFVQLHELAQTLQKPHVARLWIIIPQIHAGQGDQERYKRFCTGRHQAYETLGIRAPNFPAATVIGSAQGPMRLHALLCSSPGQTVENPQQTSAYEYPRNYGPNSPSFSRALQSCERFFVSGTAAIRGSDSLHAGDVSRQLRDIDSNLTALCSTRGYEQDWLQHAQYGRIYLRQPAMQDQLQKDVQTLWPKASQWPILHGDVCREELLCEVEIGL